MLVNCQHSFIKARGSCDEANNAFARLFKRYESGRDADLPSASPRDGAPPLDPVGVSRGSAWRNGRGIEPGEAVAPAQLDAGLDLGLLLEIG